MGFNVSTDPMHRLLGYTVWVALSVVVLIAGMRLDQADLSVPLAYHGDALLILPLVKSTVETGTHWHNDRLGAPGIQELHDFPIVDHLHFAILWLMGQVLPDYVWCFNLYHLYSYPLTVLMTMIVLRSFGVSFPAAGLAGMLYAFLPYHYIRGLGHYFLSAYWTLPLTLWPALRLLWGMGLFEKRWTALGTILIAIMTSCAGAYYAFFGCAALGFAGLYAWIAYRNWRLFASACVVIALIVIGGIANHLPAILYQAKYGPNTEVTQRQPEEAETYGLKLAQMLLPARDHNWRFFRNLRAKYDSDHRDLQNENETSTLGLLGSLTFVALIATLLLASGGRKPPESETRENLSSESSSPPAETPGADAPGSPFRPLAAMVLFLFLLGTVGGVGSLFNFLVTPEVRSLNRVSIVLAFFVFAALAIAFDRLAATRSGARDVAARAPLRVAAKRFLPWLAALALAAFGVADETHRGWFRNQGERYATIKKEWRQDAGFFNWPSHWPVGKVFCLPYIRYPETFKQGELNGYDHVRCYLHDDDAYLSFGAMAGREADLWQREVSRLPVPEMIERLVYADFNCLLFDRRGYSKEEGDAIYHQLHQPPYWRGGKTHWNGGQHYYYGIHNYRDALIAKLGQAEFDRRCEAERNRVSMLWLKGFVSFNPPGEEDKHRWCGRRGTAVIVNPSTTTRTFDVSMVLRSSPGEHGQLTIDGGKVWSETMQLTAASPLIARTWKVPPGRHTIHFNFAPMREHVPKDARDNVFFIAFFTMKEVADSR